MPLPELEQSDEQRAGATFDRRTVESLGKVADSMKSILYHDQSDVAIEKQVTEIAKNQSKAAGVENTPAKIGLILSIIFSILWVIFWILYVVAFAALFSAGTITTY